MTEQEWLDCTDPQLMLEFLSGRLSERKLRLLACAFARHCWWLIPDEEGRNTVELTERFVDGLVNADEWKADDRWVDV